MILDSVKLTSLLTIARCNPKAHGMTMAEWVPNVEVYNDTCPTSNYNEGFSSDFLVMKRPKEPWQTVSSLHGDTLELQSRPKLLLAFPLGQEKQLGWLFQV